MKQLLIFALSLLIFACTPDQDQANEMLSFHLQELPGAEGGVIVNDTVWMEVPTGTNLTALTPIIAISPKATVNPPSGAIQNFSSPVKYTVTSESGRQREYTAILYDQPSFRVNKVTLPDLYVEGTVSGESINFTLPYGTKLDAVRVNFILGEGGINSSFTSGSTLNLTQPFTWKLTKGTSEKIYTITASVGEQETGIRAVWVTNVASNVLYSEANLTAMVNKLAELNFNTICVVAYNKSQTIFPSETLAKVLGKTPQETLFSGVAWGDALATLIEKAHAKNIKVIAWFEYGFASHYAGQDSPISDLHPDWVSKDIKGEQTQKNNFYWLNGFHPEVQQFVTDMIVECVTKYNVDGVQGDDRLPALPAHAGYDDFTRTLYKQETGREVPSNPAESEFLNWKAGKMTDYAVSLYGSVKKARPSCLVTWAPSTRGWSKTNYLQDWPEWINRGVVDYIAPQLYRSESAGIGAYTSLVYNDLNSVITPAFRKRYAPGMLVRNGNEIVSDGFLAQMVQYNRIKGVTGESTWFYEAVVPKQKAFKALYPAPAIFPDLLNQ